MPNAPAAFSFPGGRHDLIWSTDPGPVTRVGRIHDADVGCAVPAVEGAEGAIYVAGRGRVVRLTPPR